MYVVEENARFEDIKNYSKKSSAVDTDMFLYQAWWNWKELQHEKFSSSESVLHSYHSLHFDMFFRLSPSMWEGKGWYKLDK